MALSFSDLVICTERPYRLQTQQSPVLDLAGCFGILIGKEVRVIRLSQNYSVYSSVLQIPMSEYYPRAVHKIIWWVTRFYIVIWFTVLGFFAGLWKPVKKKDA